MRIGEAQPFLGEPVDVRRLDVGGAVAAHIAVADIVGEDVDDVGFASRQRAGREETGEDRESGAMSSS